ncbi:MAG: class II D-tagatose-bisphosphate aldolase, non-catalytic subunit [Anaerolineales bacterium]|nr:class II D-tagatose-bisphosphate aldolase, non-catalytic subunit [Anaerolineales bacterium]
MTSSKNISVLLEKIKQNKQGAGTGIYSICSANKNVLEACLKKACDEDSIILIEATCNQVNQFGGYTGMKPIDFRNFVYSIANDVGFPVDKIILGGDHLGPYPWRDLPANTAMDNSEQMVRDYAKAGFQKIHLDASMYCADDDFSISLSKQLSAQRAVRLCEAIEATIASNQNLSDPLYVIGTEVPLPGGQQENENELRITSVEDVEETISIFRNTFEKAGEFSAWERVIAVVVQPGVEFNENEIIEYQPQKSIPLKTFIETIPGMVYEAHSTDYQTSHKLKQLVNDHFAILKVGPALTFAFREAIIGLCRIEEHLMGDSYPAKKSNLIKIISQVMDENPENWEKYSEAHNNVEISKFFSYSDRIRYYWNFPQVEMALKTLLFNLRKNPAPLTLISQYFPHQYRRIREGKLINDPGQLISDRIGEILEDYSKACC